MFQGEYNLQDWRRRGGKRPVPGVGEQFPQCQVLPLSPSKSQLNAADPPNAAFSRDKKKQQQKNQTYQAICYVFYSLFSSVTDVPKPKSKVIWSQYLESPCPFS